MNGVPEMIGDRRVRRVDVEVLPGRTIFVLEASDPDDVLEAAVAGTADAYAAVLWPSAIAAARAAVTLVFPGDVLLDVGAGTGLAALVAASKGATAIALDHDAFARAAIAEAAASQSLTVDVRDFDLKSREPLPEADVVVMADLLYEPLLAHAAARRAVEALRHGAVVVISDPRRIGRQAFLDGLADAGILAAFDDVVVSVPGDPLTSRIGVATLRP